MSRLYVFLLLLLDLIVWNQASCVNNCNKKGICNKYGFCECFDGYQGSDCSQRSCPRGRKLSSIANDTDTAHNIDECSGNGWCNHETGECSCAIPFTGNDCSRFKCNNNCNNHGECVSLRNAAIANDGYRFNRTTEYNNWDADIIYGCKCDHGWDGYDCSQRTCEYGLDPRLGTQQNETVTLVCACPNGACEGRFKVKLFGAVVNKWYTPTSRAYELADGLMTIPSIGGNLTSRSTLAVEAMDSTASNTNAYLCESGATTKTKIYFKRGQGDLPAMSFYSKDLFTANSIYFETTQTLTCDCRTISCNGTFYLSFDGEMTSRITVSSIASAITTALAGVSTLSAAGVTVSLSTSTSQTICSSGASRTHTIVMRGDVGNLPRLGLWSTVVDAASPTYYSTDYSGSILTLSTDDGRDDNVKMCNGIGKCNFDTAVCDCPHGWTYDATLGPCARIVVNNTRWAGLARCPGVVSPELDINGNWVTSLQDKPNYSPRVYLSINPSINHDYQYPATIEMFDYETSTIPSIKTASRVLLKNLSSETSAGPLAHDQSANRLYYVDQHSTSPYIGYIQLNTTGYSSSRKLVDVNYVIYGFTFDARFNQRRLYWTVPKVYGSSDGYIYYMDVDATTPSANSLRGSIGTSNIIDPMGIAVHPYTNLIYWIDKTSKTGTSSLRSCNLDGSGYSEVLLYRLAQNSSLGYQKISVNATDLFIDVYHNNTLYYIDSGTSNPSIIATNLDSLDYTQSNTSAGFGQYSGFYNNRVIVSSWEMEITSPKYMAFDEYKNVLVWTDTGLSTVSYAPVNLVDKEALVNKTDRGIFSRSISSETTTYTSNPIGIVLDFGMGSPEFDYYDCYGKGYCKGLDGNWECKCFDGYYGDCQIRTCPTGRAWWHEPAVDNIAHDEYIECSNMGLCDRNTGRCICRSGFEGNACERMSCNTESKDVSTCNNSGRCLSMRTLATMRKDSYLQSDPVSYGYYSSNPYTWDADMVYGCYGDEYGYVSNEYGHHNITQRVGYNLTQTQCPYGKADRYTDIVYGVKANYTNTQEIQLLKCEASAGSFQLSFRDATSDSIIYNSTIYELTRKLHTIRTLGQVKVEWYLNDTIRNENKEGICSRVRDRTIKITFISEIGNIPLLEVNKDELYGNVGISRSQTSTGWLYECSNRGICNRSTGECECFPNWGSSNGIGEVGERGDCGYNLIV